MFPSQRNSAFLWESRMTASREAHALFMMNTAKRSLIGKIPNNQPLSPALGPMLMAASASLPSKAPASITRRRNHIAAAFRCTPISSTHRILTNPGISKPAIQLPTASCSFLPNSLRVEQQKEKKLLHFKLPEGGNADIQLQ